MTGQLRFDDSRLQHMEQATLWLQRMRNPGQDEGVVEAWLEWYQRDPLNQQAFDEILAVWEISGGLSREAPPASRVSRQMNWRRRALAASLACLGLATVIVGAWRLSGGSAPAGVLTREYSSPIGVNTTHMLADGSLLELGGGTRVSVAIGPQQRRVDLHEGELFVTVHHETGRPFAVDAGGLEAIATGTAFNVLRTAERTTVTVAEGSVEAFYEGQATDGPNMHLQTSHQLVYSHASRTVDVRHVDPRDAITWRAGMLSFDNQPLSEVIATVNRYAARRIVIEDPQLRAFLFIGTAGTDRIEDWLRNLPLMGELPSVVEVVELADGSRLVRPRSGARPH